MRKLGLLFMSVVLIVTLSACGSNSSSSSSSSSKEVVFWNPFTGPDGENMKRMVDEYNKTNPDFKVKNISLKEGDMYTKIQTVVNSGKNVPDLMIVHAERIKQYVDNGMLTSYDDYLSDYPELKEENYMTEAWKIGDLDGSRYSVPLDIHSFIMYYNKDLVEKYAPGALDDNIVTFDEIKAAGEKAQKDKISGIGVTWVKPNMLSLYAQNGGELTDNGIDPTFNNDHSKASFQQWIDLYEAKVTNKDGEDPAQLFLQGKLIFYPEGIWMNNNLKDAKFEYGLTNAPQLHDDKSKMVNWSSSHQFVMFNSDDRSDEKSKGAIDFIDWVRDNSLEWAKAGQNPASLKILDEQEYQEMAQSFLLNDPEEQASLKIFDYKYNGYVSEELDAKGLDIIFGKIPVDKGLADIQKTLEDKIAKDTSNK
ncbi:sugar ABC transporter substrate-binding protein [Virgibacillus soli]|uniref:extracellular solute-binding protein n=1 Tax=Lederbergia galactosidilytica TaxID=217031 RepID=UPI000715A68A|nr:extracellular solute-binding protein [Lederbergia galactosidilytica]KRG16371.1 sugar ABC transporter substrate-binding protein [Virgibacillus soli]MBP1914310.1 multiple sugar transport system substrate-binding protein [Lederbergia galactosidilytica]